MASRRPTRRTSRPFDYFPKLTLTLSNQRGIERTGRTSDGSATGKTARQQAGNGGRRGHDCAAAAGHRPRCGAPGQPAGTPTEASAQHTQAPHGIPWAWGFNGFGQLGNGTTTGASTPVVVSGLNDVVAIADGSNSGYALRCDGTVQAWGDNSFGQLGDGTTTDRPTPVQVTGLNDVTALAGDVLSGYALRRDGTIRAWGFNGSGQLGDGTTTDSTTPVQVSGLNHVTAIAAGDYTGYALAGRDHDGVVTMTGTAGNRPPPNQTAVGR